MSVPSPDLRHAGNEPADTAIEENRRLGRTMRDLVALSTLKAIWSGLGDDRIAESLCQVLMSTLSLDAVYVRLGRSTGEMPIEGMRFRQSDPGRQDVVKLTLASLLETSAVEATAVIPNVLGVGDPLR